MKRTERLKGVEVSNRTPFNLSLLQIQKTARPRSRDQLGGWHLESSAIHDGQEYLVDIEQRGGDRLRAGEYTRIKV